MRLSNLTIRAWLMLTFATVLCLSSVALVLSIQALDPAKAGTAKLGLFSIFGLTVLTCITATWALTRAISQPLGEAILIAETVASGDLSQEFSTEREGEFGRLLQALGEMEDTLTDLVGRIKASTDTITDAAADIDSGHADLTRHTEEQAASLHETSHSMQQLAGTVLLNAERAESASQLASHASGIAEKGGAVVEHVVRTMDAISGSSRKIVDIIAVIDGIAFQTNILALNAAVEAARAGEQGRGFAVVAAEVRSLAQRSASAAKEISQLIGDSVRHVENGAELVTQAGTTMREVVEEVRRMTALLGDISKTSQEQREDLQRVTSAMDRMDQVTQHNVTQVSRAAQAAHALSSQAKELSSAVGAFKLD